MSRMDWSGHRVENKSVKEYLLFHKLVYCSTLKDKRKFVTSFKNSLYIQLLTKISDLIPFQITLVAS